MNLTQENEKKFIKKIKGKGLTSREEAIVRKNFGLSYDKTVHLPEAKVLQKQLLAKALRKIARY